MPNEAHAHLTHRLFNGVYPQMNCLKLASEPPGERSLTRAGMHIRQNHNLHRQYPCPFRHDSHDSAPDIELCHCPYRVVPLVLAAVTPVIYSDPGCRNSHRVSHRR